MPPALTLWQQQYLKLLENRPVSHIVVMNQNRTVYTIPLERIDEMKGVAYNHANPVFFIAQLPENLMVLSFMVISSAGETEVSIQTPPEYTFTQLEIFFNNTNMNFPFLDTKLEPSLFRKKGSYFILETQAIV